MRFLISLVLLSSLSTGCAIMRAPSKNMLNQTADYDGRHHLQETLGKIEKPLLIPAEEKERLYKIRVHPHKLPNGDYFSGGYINTLVKAPQWREQKSTQKLLPPQKKKKSRKGRKSR